MWLKLQHNQSQAHPNQQDRQGIRSTHNPPCRASHSDAPVWTKETATRTYQQPSIINARLATPKRSNTLASTGTKGPSKAKKDGNLGIQPEIAKPSTKPRTFCSAFDSLSPTPRKSKGLNSHPEQVQPATDLNRTNESHGTGKLGYLSLRAIAIPKMCVTF